MFPTFSTIATYLDATLMSSRFPDDQNGIYRPSSPPSRPVRRIGLAIEPWPDIGEWVREQRLDALFLHRPWRLDLTKLPTDVGVLAYHLAFDLTLTFGFNSRLAATLEMNTITPFAYKDGLPYGMFGDIAPTSLNDIATTLTNTFGKPPSIEAGSTETIKRLAIVGAMTETLVREAATHAVDLYITGQFRQPARLAVQQTGINVAIIGHDAGEQWGMRALADLLRERWAILDVLYKV